jgi:hypothetical protein
MTTIDTRSPERGWDPFLAWLWEHGIDPTECFQVDLGEGEDPRCVAHLWARNAEGKRYLIPGTNLVAWLPAQPFIARRPAPRRYQ